MSRVQIRAPLRMLHIGRKVPKRLRDAGWREVAGAMHMGSGLWLIPLEKPRPVSASSSPADECHADRDGDCSWAECPQEANNRANYQPWCPLAKKWTTDDED